MKSVLRVMFTACLLSGTIRPAFSQVAESTRQAAGRKLSVDVLSDSRGADMSSYTRSLTSDLRAKWLMRLPVGNAQQRLHETRITLTLAASGTVLAMHLDGSAEDRCAEQAEWDVVRDAAYAPLPDTLKATDLKLQLHFWTNESVGKRDQLAAAAEVAAASLSWVLERWVSF